MPLVVRSRRYEIGFKKVTLFAIAMASISSSKVVSQPAQPTQPVQAPSALPLKDVGWCTSRLQKMRQEQIWPNGSRYLWTDSFGIVLLLSLYKETGDSSYLNEACWVHKEVKRVLGLPSGAIRIGQAADRHGVYFHYLSMWWFALARLAEVTGDEAYLSEGIELAKLVHPHFYTKTGVWWKLKEDLSGPEPGYGKGAMDHYDGYFAYRALDPQLKELRNEVRNSNKLVQSAGSAAYPGFAARAMKRLSLTVDEPNIA